MLILFTILIWKVIIRATKKSPFEITSVKQVTQFTLHYTTYTNPGSSGSPVMDDAGNLIALHRATCTELLQALLKALGPLLEELFPQIPFKEQELILENPQGKNHFLAYAPPSMALLSTSSLKESLKECTTIKT